MKLILDVIENNIPSTQQCPHGVYDEFNGDFDCGLDTKLICEDCKYGMGRKDPNAKCNRN